MASNKTFFARLLWPIQDATYVAVVPSSLGDYVDAWTFNHVTGIMARSGVRVSPTDKLEGCVVDGGIGNATIGDLQTSANRTLWAIQIPERHVGYLDVMEYSGHHRNSRFSSLVLTETRPNSVPMVFYVVDGAPLVSQTASLFREALNKVMRPSSLRRTDDEDAMPAVLRILNT
jgi:hypothetical protein